MRTVLVIAAILIVLGLIGHMISGNKNPTVSSQESSSVSNDQPKSSVGIGDVGTLYGAPSIMSVLSVKDSQVLAKALSAGVDPRGGAADSSETDRDIFQVTGPGPKHQPGLRL